MNHEQTPVLAPPGAGLPFLENLVLRFWVMPRAAKQMTWEKADHFFARENEKILAMVEKLSEVQGTQKVLIPRLKGLEDSSRYWSVQMVLEHLIITGKHFCRIIEELGSGNVPDIKIDTAKVKPQGNSTFEETLKSFKQFIAEASSAFGKVKDRSSKAKLKHPWFGPITCHQWHLLMGSHHGVHRKQITAILEEILKGH